MSLVGFGIYDMLKGFFAVWLYAAIRPKFSPGIKTAVIAGVAAWVALAVIPHVTWLVIPVFAKSFVAKWMIFEGAPIVLGTIAGAWIYKE